MTSDTQKSINRKFWQMKRVYFSLAAAFALGAFSGLAVLCPGHGGMTTDAVASTSGSGAVGSADASTDDSVQTDTAPLDTKTVEMDPSVNDPADVEAAPNSHLYPAEPHGVVDHVDEELLQRAPPPPHTASSPVLSTANKAGPRLREMKPSQPGCEGPEVHDTELYWEHVAEDRRIRFLPAATGKTGYDDSAAQCASVGREVCTQDQLGAAWFLGYENGCRGWVRDEFGKGIEQFAQEAFHEEADRVGERITAMPLGESLAALGWGMNAKFAKEAAAVGVYCCATRPLHTKIRTCDPQKAETAGEVSLAHYMRYQALVTPFGASPVLIGGTLIGALRNASILPECVEAKHKSGLLNEEPDIDIITPAEPSDPSSTVPTPIFDWFQYSAHKAAFAKDYIFSTILTKKKEGHLKYRTHVMLSAHCGFKFPRIKSIWAPLYWRDISAFIEEWGYYKGNFTSGSQQGKSYFIDESDIGGPICAELLQNNNLIPVDVSYGAINATAYVPGAGADMLTIAYGEWRVKTNKQSYAAGGKKSRSWHAFAVGHEEAGRMCEKGIQEARSSSGNVAKR